MNVRMLILALLVCVMIVSPLQALATVTEEVKKTVDEVINIVQSEELKKKSNEASRRAALKKAIGRIFDYGEMARRSLATHWKGRTPVEQKEFVSLFETLLENSYAGKIESYNQERIVYLKENVEDTYAEVKSKVVTARRDEFTMDYRLMNKGGKWLVYDVVIEGVSLVSNYRTQFNKIVTSEGYGSLVKKMKTKSEEIREL